MMVKQLSTSIRRLVPESPRCARFAAGGALAALALQALCHLSSLAQVALARFNAFFSRKAPLATISGVVFSVQFYEESVYFLPSAPFQRLRMREMTPLDRQVLELIRAKVREKATREPSPEDTP